MTTASSAGSPAGTPPAPPIDIDRLMAEIEMLSTLSDAPAPAVTRVLYTPQDMAARATIKQLAEDAGLTWREDALGNLFIRLAGTRPELPAVGTGSHTDAIPFSGKYDGVVGVLGGLEALRAIKAAGITPARSLELIMFTAEEPTRFGVGCVGSRAMAGMVDWDALAALEDADGVTLDDARKAAGFHGPLQSVELPADTYAFFVELHIEQGARLEAAGVDIGVVTAIAASTTLRVTVEGEGGHAGSMLMPGRRDALVAAAKAVLLVERTAVDHASPDAVATVGMLDVHPSASNSIPSRVQFTVDVRDRDAAVRDALVDAILAGLDDISTRRNVSCRITVVNADPSAASHPAILDAIEDAARTFGLSSMPLVSRAYHDTVFMGQRFPVAMIFIPSQHGYSHRPEEYSTPVEIANGVRTLAATLLALAQTE